MPKIRMAWASARIGDGGPTVKGHGRWVADTAHNRHVLAESLAYVEQHQTASNLEFWLETRKPRARKASRDDSASQIRALPWWGPTSASVLESSRSMG
ncbi:hypothetical protein EC845_3488 [Comamonas sp. BIGb0124]|uniref:hypothetical protein n=1 Tax=Comamonas sp. BIGb0124 TaxID=2485130 RepID=UPI000FB0A47D|nr:hypothetical protein [Comamonas sp. BIGb0124]ROR18514.1 hypothetical protein EC845_3488 [Comamonas sp. BIGb0124]